MTSRQEEISPRKQGPGSSMRRGQGVQSSRARLPHLLVPQTDEARACPAKVTTVLPYLWPPGEAHCEQGPGSSRQRWVTALPNCSCFRPFQVPPSHRPQHSLINEWPSSWASCIEAPRRLANLSRLSSSLPSAIVELIEPRLQLTSTAIHPGRDDYLLSLDTQS